VLLRGMSIHSIGSVRFGSVHGVRVRVRVIWTTDAPPTNSSNLTASIQLVIRARPLTQPVRPLLLPPLRRRHALRPRQTPVGRTARRGPSAHDLCGLDPRDLLDPYVANVPPLYSVSRIPYPISHIPYPLPRPVSLIPHPVPHHPCALSLTPYSIPYSVARSPCPLPTHSVPHSPHYAQPR
jgi:hypothetical protein